MNDFGPHQYGAKLFINEPVSLTSEKPVFIDLETDEKDNFVGAGYTQNGVEVYYTTDLYTIGVQIGTNLNQTYLKGSSFRLVGHNLKADAKWLAKWGVKIKPEQLQDDTILMSYAINSTKESHSLKDLGKELGYEWPTYSEMVDKGRKKVTLDKQDVSRVGAYCAMDVMVTYKLWEHLQKKMDLNARRIYQNIEMPLMRILYEMELQGVLIDVEKLRNIDGRFRSQLDLCRQSLARMSGKPDLNPNSNRQIAEILEGRGISLPTTQKGNKKVDKFVLEQHQDDGFVKDLIEYNKIEKLVSTYTGGFLKRETLPKIYTTYNQVVSQRNHQNETGISTGRLSSSDPNLQQIPTRTEEGRLLRELFVPRGGFVLIDADYSQIEYRLLAHFSKEPILLEAFKNGKDVHEATGKALGVDRDTGKTLNFASIYGAQAQKIANTAKVSEEEAKKFLEKYWNVLPSVTAWIKRVKFEASKKGGIFTLMKRWIPIQGFDSRNKYDRWAAERMAVNYLVQGSAAEIMKMAMIELRKKGYLPLLTVHDELLFEVQEPAEWLAKERIKETMESVVTLDVPLVADIGIGSSWREAKE